MKRRRVLTGACGVFATVLAGCSSGDEISDPTPTKSPTPSPTPTPEPKPKITDVTVTQVSLPLKPNPLTFQIRYSHLDTVREYRLRATAEFSTGPKSNSKQVKKVHGYYPGLDGFGLRPPEDASTESDFIDYFVQLLHNGEVLDEVDGSLSYE